MALTVLLVEDNEDNRTVYALILEHLGYAVLQAADGGEALRMAREHLPELILMDISIPVIDGWEAIRRLRGEEPTAGIPVVALTAHAFETDRERARSLGCAGYIPKPAEPLRVAAEVRRLIGSPREDGG